METSQEKIDPSPRFRGQVIRQVYRVWLVRKLLPVLVIEMGIFSFILYKLGQAIFVQKIINNALTVLLNKPLKSLSFLTGAFGHAPIFTKLLGLGIIILLALLLRHLTQGVLRLILVKENYFSRIEKK